MEQLLALGRAQRALYAQLVEHHREIYDDPTIGGEDPDAGFDEYLALPERVLTWVAVEDGAVIGVTGLVWVGDESTIEPVVVDPAPPEDGRIPGVIRINFAEYARAFG